MIREQSTTSRGGSSISSTTREQKWPTLTQLGGWHDVQLDLDGNGTFGDSNEYDEDRSYNKVNELEEIDDGVASPIPMSHDANGNFGYDGANYDYEYDAFNRLVQIERHSDSAEIESFRYNGLGYRIVMGTTSNPEHLVYNEKWQMIALFDDTDTDPTEEFIHHGAGYDGRGGSSYIDSVILRDRDTTGNGTLDERYYYIQNWRADVVALITDTGEQVEGTRYTAYGVPFGGYAGDVNNDGDVTAADTTQIQTWIAGPTYDVRGDLDLDGDVDSTDKDTATTNIGTNVGWKNLTEINVDNRRGYAGYEHDLVIQRKYSAYHVRHRVLNSTFGQWMQRATLYSPLARYRFLIPNQAEAVGDSAVAESILAPVPILPDGTESDDPNHVTCCNRWRAEKRRQGRFNNPPGTTICCGGSIIACIWEDDYKPTWTTTPHSPSDWNLVKRCIIRHEQVHMMDLDCNKRCCGGDFDDPAEPCGPLDRTCKPDRCIRAWTEERANEEEKRCLEELKQQHPGKAWWIDQLIERACNAAGEHRTFFNENCEGEEFHLGTEEPVFNENQHEFYEWDG